MKKNYKVIIGYDGTRYFGWEHQPNKDTIQGKIEVVLEHLCETPEETEKEAAAQKLALETAGGMKQPLVEVIGAGRTDAGVHAQGMVANFFLDTELDTEALRDYMNHYLPDDIVIKEVREASDRFHSRYNAVGKTYRYTCFDGVTKPIFDRKYVYTLEQRLDVDKMKEAARYLIGEHDFCSFCKNPQKKKSTVRTVDKIEIMREKDYVTFTFHGNGFLRNMVRILVGTLLGVGMGEIEPEKMKDILEAKERETAGVTAPAKGLCLIEVDYF